MKISYDTKYDVLYLKFGEGTPSVTTRHLDEDISLDIDEDGRIAGIEVLSATDDGSVGYRGLVTDLIPEYAAKADQVFACGPEPMYRHMAAHRKQLFGKKPVQISLEERMGCGFGVCYGCTIKTKKGLKQVCQDGPVFELDEILWQEQGHLV